MAAKDTGRIRAPLERTDQIVKPKITYWLGILRQEGDEFSLRPVYA